MGKASFASCLLVASRHEGLQKGSVLRLSMTPVIVALVYYLCCCRRLKREGVTRLLSPGASMCVRTQSEERAFPFLFLVEAAQGQVY